MGSSFVRSWKILVDLSKITLHGGGEDDNGNFSVLTAPDGQYIFPVQTGCSNQSWRYVCV